MASSWRSLSAGNLRDVGLDAQAMRAGSLGARRRLRPVGEPVQSVRPQTHRMAAVLDLIPTKMGEIEARVLIVRTALHEMFEQAHGTRAVDMCHRDGPRVKSLSKASHRLHVRQLEEPYRVFIAATFNLREPANEQPERVAAVVGLDVGQKPTAVEVVPSDSPDEPVHDVADRVGADVVGQVIW